MAPLKAGACLMVFGIAAPLIASALFKQLQPTSTAEAVAFVRHMMSDVGLLNEGVSRVFFPYKSWFWTATPSLRDTFLQAVLGTGAMSHLATRTWFYDRHLMSLLKPDMQVVICGAGFDSRAHRLHVPRGVRFFELDLAQHPGVQEYKVAQLAKYGLSSDGIVHLPIDFKRESISEVLMRGGHDPRKPTIFLWEGVTMYLNKEAIEVTVREMRKVAAPGSYLLCELFSARLLTEEAKADPSLSKYWKQVSKSGEAYSFGVWPKEMPKFWTSMQVHVVEHQNPEAQQKEWLMTPGTARWTDDDLPHGGVCHLFLLKLK